MLNNNFLLCICRENHKHDVLKEDYANLAGTKQHSVVVLSMTEVLMTHHFQATSFLGCYTESSRPDTNRYNTVWSEWRKCKCNLVGWNYDNFYMK